MYNVEKGVPITPKRANDVVVFLQSLEIGDSFLVPNTDIGRICAAAKRAKIGICTRKQPSGQYRIWKQEYKENPAMRMRRKRSETSMRAITPPKPLPLSAITKKDG